MLNALTLIPIFIFILIFIQMVYAQFSGSQSWIHFNHFNFEHQFSFLRIKQTVIMES